MDGLCTGAVELRNAVLSKFSLELPATLTFDYPTISAMVGYIAEKLVASDQSVVARFRDPALVHHPGLPNAATPVTEVVGISSSVAASGARDRGACPFPALVFIFISVRLMF